MTAESPPAIESVNEVTHYLQCEEGSQQRKLREQRGAYALAVLVKPVCRPFPSAQHTVRIEFCFSSVVSPVGVLYALFEFCSEGPQVCLGERRSTMEWG